MKMLFGFALACLTVTTTVARAERPIQPRSKATHVVSGEVSKVYTRDSGHYTEYLVEIRIGKVEKGDDLKKSTYAYVHVSDRKANAPLEPSASGHAVPPKMGTPVRAWTMEIRGRLMGLYPNWFEKLPRKKKKSG